MLDLDMSSAVGSIRDYPVLSAPGKNATWKDFPLEELSRNQKAGKRF